MLKRWSRILLIFLVFPASGAYKLDGYNIGGGGQLVGSSNFNANVVVGDNSANKLAGTGYDLGAGLVFVEQSHTPQAPSLDNNSGTYYNKLHLVVNNVSQSGVTFPAETKFAVAISKDGFATTQFVKSDGTVGGSLAVTDYLTYAGWGSSQGVLIVGLDVGTSYSVRVTSIQTNLNESGWGPIATASTANPSFTFSINVGVSDQVSSPPYVVVMDDLINDVVVTSNSRVWVHMDTNANNGASVYVLGQNGGLRSSLSGYTITSVSTDLGSTNVGFGLQGVGVTQASGGPLSIVPPYNGTGNVVGQVSGVYSNILTTSSPMTGGVGSFVVKAKSANDTPEGGDYTEVLTLVGSANF